MQHITTKCSTGASGACKVYARASGGGRGCSVRLGWDYGLNGEQNHLEAFKSLARRLGWLGVWHYSGSRDGGFVFVVDDPDSRIAI